LETRNVNITPGGTTPVIHVSQNDVGRTVTFNVTDGNDWYDLTGCTVKLQGIKPSGLGYTVTGTVNDHTVTIITTKQMTDEYGNIASELKVTKNDLAIGTANIILAVERDPHPEHTTDGSMDTLIPELTVLVERVEAAVAKEEVLHEAEAWAVGKRSGEDVPSTDPTYHNNSKYYKELAAGSAASADSRATAAEGYKNAAAGSASEAAQRKTEAETAKTAAEAAQAAAEAAAQQASNTFQIAGDTSISVDPSSKKVTLHVTVSESD
jgi:hypothetical protein